MLRIIILSFGFYLSFELLSQEVDTIYVEFDDECSFSYFAEDEERVTFILHPQINESRFIHKKGFHLMKHTCCMKIKNQLFSKAKLNELAVELHMEGQKDFEEKTGMKGLPPVIPSLNLNALFDKIYIYKSIDANCGFLYEVKWIPAL